MKFIETRLKGAYIIEPERLEDERGFFARSFCQKEFKDHELNPQIVQCNLSYNKKCGTLRGMHYQKFPYKETKQVSCIQGAIYDVIIDLRKNSPTYRQWLALELNSENNKIIYIPENFAHGFQTLEDNTVVYYQMSEFYHPECATGIRWDDHYIGIDWPIKEKMIISKRDQEYKNFG